MLQGWFIKNNVYAWSQQGSVKVRPYLSLCVHCAVTCLFRCSCFQAVLLSIPPGALGILDPTGVIKPPPTPFDTLPLNVVLHLFKSRLPSLKVVFTWNPPILSSCWSKYFPTNFNTRFLLVQNKSQASYWSKSVTWPMTSAGLTQQYVLTLLLLRQVFLSSALYSPNSILFLNSTKLLRAGG